MSTDGWIEDPERPGLYLTESGIGYDLIEGVHFTRTGAMVNLSRFPKPVDYDTGLPNG